MLTGTEERLIVSEHNHNRRQVSMHAQAKSLFPDPLVPGRKRGSESVCQFHRILDKGLTLQGGPSGRGQAFVDIERRIVFEYKKFILWRNF